MDPNTRQCYPVPNMRKLVFAALFFGAALSAFGQAAAPPQTLPKNPHEILAMAAPYYDFNDPALKPWHLKATYQLYDDQGKPTEQGTFEYWWATPKVHRSSWTRPGASHTSWHTANGAEAHVETGERLGYFEAGLPSDLLSPLPSPARVDPSKTRLIRNSIKLAGASFPCVSEAPLKGEEPPNFRMLPTECFDATLPVLRFELNFQGVVATTYDNVVKFQGKYLARKIDVVVGKQKLFTAAVDAIDSLNPNDPALVPSRDAIFKPDAAQSTGKVELGSLVKKQPPVYPPAAKLQNIQGTVLIEAAIGTDGKIKDPRVIFSPSPLLSTASLEAILHWEYKPYMLNGTPIEVDTVINVTFALGR